MMISKNIDLLLNFKLIKKNYKYAVNKIYVHRVHVIGNIIIHYNIVFYFEPSFGVYKKK